MKPLKVQEKMGAFVPCPAGTHNAVCVDVVEIEGVERSYGGKTWKEDQLRFVFQIEKKITKNDLKDFAPDRLPDAQKLVGQRFSIRTFGMKQSVDPKANLRKFIEAWLGRPMRLNETLNEDVELVYGDEVTPLVGLPCFLTVVHKMGGDHGTTVYANVGGIAPIMVDSETGKPLKAPLKPENYVRAKDREQVVANAENAAESGGFEPVGDDDIPF